MFILILVPVTVSPSTWIFTSRNANLKMVKYHPLNVMQFLFRNLSPSLGKPFRLFSISRSLPPWDLTRILELWNVCMFASDLAVIHILLDFSVAVMKWCSSICVAVLRIILIFPCIAAPILIVIFTTVLLSSIASIQQFDWQASFISVEEFDAYHHEWLNSISPTNQHGQDALDSANLFGCKQIVRSSACISRCHLALHTNVRSR